MRCDKQAMLLYAVTDSAWIGRQTLYEQVECALQGGVTCVQLRDKHLAPEALLAQATQISALCRRYGVPMLVNDDVDIAIRCGADGVHVGQSDMEAGRARRLVGENMILGVSVHSVAEAQEAVRCGADYLGVGAMFATQTKADADVLELQVLADICRAVTVPVVAIGGIGRHNLMRLKGTGVDGVALVSAIFSAEDIRSECRLLKALAQRMVDA